MAMTHGIRRRSAVIARTCLNNITITAASRPHLLPCTSERSYVRHFSECNRFFKENGGSSGVFSQSRSQISQRSTRDSTTRPQPSRFGSTSTLRRTVMDEVAIPGKYQIYFKPDKRATRKQEGGLKVERTRAPKKVAAARSNRTPDEGHANLEQDDVSGGSTTHGENYTDDTGSIRTTNSTAKGFDNVAWRALEYIYAREVLPHPLLHRDYLEITEIKVLPDRKTFQLWYRPKPDIEVTSDQIVEALSKHGHALKAMLARHARQTSSSRLSFQFVRQSDRQAMMDTIWRKLEAEAEKETAPKQIIN
ncbi:hypothetical protein BG004_007046 [Podila humilis]|nr:hypothetical protein BG004_007046 [Podila humilis]